MRGRWQVFMSASGLHVEEKIRGPPNNKKNADFFFKKKDGGNKKFFFEQGKIRQKITYSPSR